jgi:hypothetical protein
MSLTAMNMDVASEDSSHQVVPCAPNMCITPAAPSPLPMPYPLKCDTGMLDPGTDKTMVGSDKKILTLNGKAKMCMGNEPGVQKDVVTMQTDGHAGAIAGIPCVMFEGAPVVVTGMPGFINTM